MLILKTILTENVWASDIEIYWNSQLVWCLNLIVLLKVRSE